MSFVSSLPKRDVTYDIFRAKLSLMYILDARGYNLREDVTMLDETVPIPTKYEKFLKENKPLSHPGRRDEFIPLVDTMEKKYTNSTGILSPLIVIFSDSKKLFEKIKGMMVEKKTKKKTKNPPSDSRQHYLFVVDYPVSDNQISSIIGVNTFEILSYQNLFLNPLQHYRSPSRIQDYRSESGTRPSVTKLSEEEKEAMLTNPAIQGKVLPGLDKNDPLILYLNMEPGGIYRSVDVKAYTKQNMYTVGYRIAPKVAKCTTDECPNTALTFSTSYCKECLTK
jgi:DNA-directed RNA polymerase subunit H (RpoH/RPB5)